jgi:predicted anti-sigma-YlaC factor YlaD
MRTAGVVCAVAAALAAGGCSVRKFAVNQVGNALASGGSTYESDDDVDLVGGALPFSLKLVESLLAESPKHRGLLLTAASGFAQYSYAYVEEQADQAAADSLDRAAALRARARRLYRRAFDYGMRGLDAACPGFRAALENDPAAALARVRRRDLPLLYWTAAAHGLAISASKDDPEMIAQLPEVEAMIRRAEELDAGWNRGALPEFLINIESARSGIKAEELQQRMRQHYERSLELSGGRRASLYVTYAEKAMVPAQNRAEFKALIEKALAIDPDRDPPTRLANLIAQRRARWLLTRTDELFLEPEAAPQ